MTWGLALLAGLLQGAAFLGPAAQPLAWVGVACVAAAVHRAPGGLRAAGMLALAALARQVVALHWWVGTARHFAPGVAGAALTLAALGWAMTAAASQVPAMAWVLTPARRVPPRFWLPFAWAAGEAVAELTCGFSMTQLLHSQWAQPAVLNALAFVGWGPLLLLCLYASASVGEAASRRDLRLLTPAGLVLGALACAPATAPLDDALSGVGVVHLASSAHLPRQVPEGTSLLVWPESTVRGNQRLPEGALPHPVPLAAFADTQLPVAGIAGLTLRTEGHYLNAAGAFDAEGRLTQSRGKAVLVPVGERAFLGLRGSGEPLTPGTAVPRLSVAGRSVVPLICYEAFSRPTALQGQAAGGTLLAVLASDLPLVGSHFAQEQAVGAVILRAVEQHLPAVRASLAGPAVIVSSDGRVLARSEPGTSGVLTLEKRAPTYSPAVTSTVPNPSTVSRTWSPGFIR
ncbi:nitrilase-related carbon-nitrogen hydrolase [Corallococcus sp. EGB]|uniref:nitrilase-related carbon-nitrogen hydrolase n=1 Tax=Corallococcus sp. EGB TaxID=1521117 RepID=UPI001CBFDF63|nr:nitrilase-related carbon-nitrogen hydrolase [Corallococcus sp. EGB]